MTTDDFEQREREREREHAQRREKEYQTGLARHAVIAAARAQRKARKEFEGCNCNGACEHELVWHECTCLTHEAVEALRALEAQ